MTVDREQFWNEKFESWEQYKHAMVATEQRPVDFPSWVLDRLSHAEARLAKVPALVEALRRIDQRERRSDYTNLASAPAEFANVAREALAEWDAEA